MANDYGNVDYEKPLWRRIIDFPLVTMVLATLIFILTGAAALFAAKLFPDPTGAEQIVWKLIYATLLIIVYKLVISRMGEIKRDDLRTNGALRDLSVGLGVGAGIMVVIALIAAVLNVYSITGPGDTINLFPEIIAMGVFPAISEEILFRGILFRWFEELGGSWFALAITSGLFGFAHLSNPGATPLTSFFIAVEAGILLGAAYMLTRSLWLPMGLHAAWNLTQGEVLDVSVSGVPVDGLVTAQVHGPVLLSGGRFGFEGSVLGLLFATAVGLWFLVRAIRKGELMPPWWVRRRIVRNQAAIEAPAEA
jgi:membrane protease YdiL (CAAX protease family)